MNEDRRLIYSTEDGRLDKAMRNSVAKRRKLRKKPSAAPTIKKAGKQGIRIRRESRGRGGKTVSIIDGLELAETDLKSLLKRLKGRLGAGGAVKGGMLEIQGDHRDKLLLFLEKEGYKAKLSGS